MKAIIQINKNWEDKLFLFTIAVVALTIPFNTAINSVFSITILGYWLIFKEKKIKRNENSIISFFFLSSYFVLSVIGLIHTENYHEALFRIQQRTAIILFPIVFIFIKIDYSKLYNISMKYFRLGVLATCLYCIGYSIIKYIDSRSIEHFFGHNICRNLELYPYLLSFFCLLSILSILFQSNNIRLFNKENAYNLLQILIFSLIIFLIGNRQVLLLYFLTISFLVFKLSNNKKFVLIGYLILFGLGISLVQFNPYLNQKVKEVIQNKENTIQLDQDASLGRSWNGVAIRKAIWECAKEPIINNILIGAGTGDVQDELQKAYEDRMFYFASRYNTYNAHNQYIQTLIGQGIFGLLFLIASILFPLIKLKFDYQYSLIAISFAVIFMTESVLETNKGIIIFSFMNTLFFLYRFSELKSKI